MAREPNLSLPDQLFCLIYNEELLVQRIEAASKIVCRPSTTAMTDLERGTDVSRESQTLEYLHERQRQALMADKLCLDDRKSVNVWRYISHSDIV